jgi:tryptophanyl-tRNA synthetase
MRVLSGIQPSGDLHIGNYFGMIKKMVEAQDDSNNEPFAFVANYHAMTSVRDGEKLSNLTFGAVVDFLSLGVDPQKTTFWVQSDVKDVLELYWILSSFTPMGLLERAHSYKDKVAKGIAANHSLFSYPVLMAADILLYDTNVVPVGKDQIQHVEITRDIATKFNNEYGDVFVLPEYRVDDNVATVIGTDGAKMSKSYGNTIEIFSDKKPLDKKIKKIVTDSTPLEEPKEYEECNVYNLAKLFLDKDAQIELQNRYKAGGEGYGHFKKYLTKVMWEYFAPYREKREYYLNNKDIVYDIINDGAKKANSIASEKMGIIREKIGLKF